jgi:ribosomal protein S12 methylthiotransferase accessory factor
VFDAPEGLVVRSVAGAFRIEPAHRQAVQRALARLDGAHDLAELLGGLGPPDAFYALGLLASFAEAGLVTEGAHSSPAPAVAGAPPGYLAGLTVVLLDTGLFSAALGRSFEALGATVCRGGLAQAQACGAVAVACPDGPDLLALEATNRSARAAQAAWLPVFPFGDGLITGPLFRPPLSPCFRCFELRWLGIAPSITLERAYFAHLRGGAWRGHITAQDAQQLADLVSVLAAHRLAGAQGAAERVALTRPGLGSTTEATLEPCPSCDVCAPAAAPASEPAPAPAEALWLDAPSSLAELAPRLEEVVRQPCGLAQIVDLPEPVDSGPQLPEVVLARFARPDPDDVGLDQDNWCHGAALSREEARAVAIIEALERYNGLSPPAPGIWASYASVAAYALLPTELPLFSEAEYARGLRFQPFDPQRVLRWNWGRNLTRKRPVLVPTSAAWYGSTDELVAECSNGVAAHSSRGHALLNGVLELVERDAFMIHWLHRLSPPQIEAAGVPDEPSRAVIRHVEQVGYAVHLLDLTTDLGIPIVLALGTREDRRKPALLVGAGAALALPSALWHALRELYAAARCTTELWRLGPPLDPADLHNLADHSRAYQHPDWLRHASFLWASSRRTTWPAQGGVPERSYPAALADLIERLAAHGHDVIGVDLTGPDVARRGLANRLFVVRAIVPGLQPLALAGGGRLGGRRLYEAPVRMGCHTEPAHEADLNPIPHCFP